MIRRGRTEASIHQRPQVRPGVISNPARPSSERMAVSGWRLGTHSFRFLVSPLSTITHLRVSGLGSREPGSGLQVRVRVRVLNLTLVLST